MKLNLGCGNDYREGFINLDCGNCRADVHHDLNQIPYPFKDNQFSYIFAQQVLEHVDSGRWFDIVRELHRISKPGSTWEIRAPYALSDNFFTDPTHRMPLTPRSFDFFDKTKALGELGAIYGIDFELRVLQSCLVENKPNGPDVSFKISVVKDVRGEGDHLRVGIVNCVSEAFEMLRFSSEQLIFNAGTDNFDYIIVCWNTTPEVDRYIEQCGTRFKESHPRLNIIRIDHETNKEVGYVANLRAMMNDGFQKAFDLNEYSGLVNTDQAFYKDWLINLVKYADPGRMVTSTLIEVGPTRHHQANFGMTEYGKFDQQGFNTLCEQIIQPGKLITSAEREGIGGDPGYKNILSLPYLFPCEMWKLAGPWELTLDHGTPDVNFFDRAHNCGFEFVMSGDSITYHIGGVERGVTGRVLPVFAKDMPYDPTSRKEIRGIRLLRRVASRLSREATRMELRVKLLFRGKYYRKQLINRVMINKGLALDIGCGGLKNTALEDFLVPRKFNKITGIDIHPPSIEERRAWYQSNDRYEFICTDIREMGVKGEYDLVTMFHVIEHLSEEEAAKVLDYVKTIAHKQIILETPDQFENGMGVVRNEKNPHQKHESLITQSFMEQHGFIKVGSYIQVSGFTNSIFLYERKLA